MSIKVLLVDDVEKLGWLGDVVEVSDGFARNYLLPQGLATIPTEANLRSLAQEKAKRAEQRLQEKERLERAAEAVDGAEVVIAAKANEQGHLFGSVSAGQIAANLRDQGFEVADEIVRLSEHIKEIGTYKVPLKFSSEQEVSVTVVVVPEQSDGEKESSETSQSNQEDT